VLYEALTGTLPFDAPNNFALLRAVVENDPIPITELAVADAELWKIMEPALRKNRDQRWQSMRAFGAALASWLITHGVRQDICGASLESTWLAAKNEDGSRSSAPPARPEPEGAPKVHAEVTGETAAMLSLPAASAGTKARKIWAVSLIAVMFVAGFGLARRFVVPVSSGGSGATSVSAAGESNGSLKTAVQGGQRPSPELLAAELPNRAANSEAADSAAPASSANRRTSARAWLRRGAGGEPRVKASTSELKLPY
jgi:hypothetical protein